MIVGLLVFPGVQQLDLTGPYEVFASVPGWQVHLVAASLDPVVSATGLVLVPDVTFDDCPDLDLVCVPGGGGIDALLTDEAVLAFLRRQATSAQRVTAVCTGALVLGAAGLLDGRRATTHWASHHLLAAFGAEPVHERVVVDGPVATGGGVTAGIDLALAVVADVEGPLAAQTVQLALEYAPAPPFDAGHPATADADVVAAARARLATTLARREQVIAELTDTGR